MNKLLTLSSVMVTSILLAGCRSLPLSITTPAPTVTPTSTPQTLSKPESITLSAVKNSGQSGTATIEEVGGKVKVTIALTGKKMTLPEPAHIHVGNCAKPGNVIYPLSDVIDGKSITMLSVDMATLKSKGQTLINVHKSPKESNVYMACGELKNIVTASPTPMSK
jgi:hypothetical protein